VHRNSLKSDVLVALNEEDNRQPLQREIMRKKKSIDEGTARERRKDPLDNPSREMKTVLTSSARKIRLKKPPGKGEGARVVQIKSFEGKRMTRRISAIWTHKTKGNLPNIDRGRKI